jgi:MFS family permease
LLLGALFGSFEVVAVAFAQEHGNRAYAGPLLAMWSLGSLIGGLFFGARKYPTPLPKVFLLALGVLTVASAPFVFAPSVPVAGVMFMVAGVAVSPSLIAGFSLVECIAPEGRLNEALSWASTGLGIGIALAATLAGAIIDAHGAHVAFLVGSSATALALLTAVSGRREIAAAYRPMNSAAANDTDPGALPEASKGRD